MISGAANGSVTEAGGVNNGTPGTPTATGDLNSTDVDNPNDLWVPVNTPLRSQFGTYTLTEAGVWTYTLDDDNPAVQARNVGQTLTDTFAVFTVGGTAAAGDHHHQRRQRRRRRHRPCDRHGGGGGRAQQQ